MAKKLYRSNNRVFSGVLGGFAEYFDWDPTLVRVIFVVAALITSGFPLLIAYIVAAIIMPEAPHYESNDSRKDITPDQD
ncbi:putative nickel-responsive transcriptional regulator NikR [Weissella oryzae SG25]|uniref:Putative nickel-responsive transcriptional regulator NikR n=1 Tax=Weissella oryzae (strain DSM 25784 / JCM 18191 / LMG 30913 / SG25) TaxID=1329250 RepID=A0A069CWG8_WEIOS|nr:PspC domain-containing protein [Weissella oryzae]GAK31769.1 putative nickel-responsive transcriptional regulator NikR [Weissella oryzae SG25]